MAVTARTSDSDMPTSFLAQHCSKHCSVRERARGLRTSVNWA